MNNHRLHRLLRERLGITESELSRLEEESLRTGTPLAEVVLQRGLVSRDRLYELLADELNIPYVDLRSYLVDENLLALIPAELARRLKVLPLFQVGDTLSIATATPEEIAALDELRQRVGMEVNPVLVEPQALEEAIDQFYPKDETAAVSAALTGSETLEALEVIEAESARRPVEELASEAPVVRFVNGILEQAIADRASDIHIEPEENELRVRLRIDGLLRETGRFPGHLIPVVTSRIKILAGMDISEKRKPQDGQFRFTTDARTIDIRVSTFPTIHGENVVLRLLDRSRALLRPTELGLSPSDALRFQTVIQQPHGIILVTGPTGSGKTTTLYCILSELNSPERNIVTLEDPVEYRLPLVRQCQVNPRAGMTFATGLRAILRQDPDIILVGEIRDRETAEIAFQAALTGHLVLATLHTNDAASGLTRMIDMNLEPFLIASSVIAIL
ncbi:MAG: GspE/PulE family protein, partial [candidate division WOR-3 bacterium]